MNVACTACPAKYAVPDERVRGKRARITCKHCGTSIIVDGTSLGPSDGGSVVAARPARKTMVGMGQVGAPATSAPVHSAPVHSAPLNSAPSNAPLSGGSAWLVALPDGRREPASQARIVDLFAAGTIDASTYIWREGMPEWKTPFTVPDVAAALTARGLKPKPISLFPGENDPDEETRIATSAVDDPVIARARAAAQAALRPAPAPTARPAAAARRSLSPPPPEDDDGITIARSGPPSRPASLPPLRRASDPPPASAPARPAAPSAVRSVPANAAPPPRGPSEPPANPLGRRPRAHTLPGDLVIPLTGPAAPPPTPLFAPRGQPFANRGAGSSAPPAQSAMVVPSAPSSSPPPQSPPPPPRSAPPAAVLPEAVLTAAQSAVNQPAPARNPLEFEVPPRSAAPVSVPLEFSPGPQRRRRTLATVASLGVLAVAGLGFAAYWNTRARPLKPAAAAPAASATVVAATPSALPAAPSASAEPETAEPTPEPSAEPAKPSARERSVSARSAPSRREETAKPAAPRKAELAKTEPAVGDSEKAASGEGESEAPARAEETSKKVDTGPAGSAPFDRESASQALTDAALRASTCRMLGGPMGSSQATVTFAPSGHVTAASVGGDFSGSIVGACIVKLFRAATVPAFSGEPVTVAKRFNVE